MRRILYVILFTCTAVVSAKAQITSCAQTLRLARSTYEQGRLHEIPVLLQRCLEGGFSHEEKIEAYKILALSYIYLEEPENADNAMLNILRADPEFQINPTVDPAEFIALYNSFRTNPIYSIGLKLSPTYNWFNTVSSNGVNDLNGTYGNAASENTAKLGFEGGIVFDIPFTKQFSVMPEFTFFTGSVETNNEDQFVTDDQKSLGSVQLVHTFSGVQVPINAVYTFFDKKYDPYVSLGVTPSYILSSKITATRFITGYGPVTERSFDGKDLINAFNFSAQVSAGVRYKVKRGFLYGEVRFSMGLTTLTDTDAVYDALPELAFAYGYPANINKLNSLSLSLGYMRNQYNPKKKNSR